MLEACHSSLPSQQSNPRASGRRREARPWNPRSSRRRRENALSYCSSGRRSRRSGRCRRPGACSWSPRPNRRRRPRNRCRSRSSRNDSNASPRSSGSSRPDRRHVVDGRSAPTRAGPHARGATGERLTATEKGVVAARANVASTPEHRRRIAGGANGRPAVAQATRGRGAASAGQLADSHVPLRASVGDGWCVLGVHAAASRVGRRVRRGVQRRAAASANAAAAVSAAAASAAAAARFRRRRFRPPRPPPPLPPPPRHRFRRRPASATAPPPPLPPPRRRHRLRCHRFRRRDQDYSPYHRSCRSSRPRDRFEDRFGDPGRSPSQRRRRRPLPPPPSDLPPAVFDLHPAEKHDAATTKKKPRPMAPLLPSARWAPHMGASVYRQAHPVGTFMDKRLPDRGIRLRTDRRHPARDPATGSLQILARNRCRKRVRRDN